MRISVIYLRVMWITKTDGRESGRQNPAPADRDGWRWGGNLGGLFWEEAEHYTIGKAFGVLNTCAYMPLLLLLSCIVQSRY